METNKVSILFGDMGADCVIYRRAKFKCHCFPKTRCANSAEWRAYVLGEDGTARTTVTFRAVVLFLLWKCNERYIARDDIGRFDGYLVVYL